MKIVTKGTMPNGTEIQLEDWSEHNTITFPDLYGLTIGAYPKAQRTGEYRLVQGGHKFRLSIANNKYAGYTNEQVRADYEALISGEKKLEDLSCRFWNGEKDMWYLGMRVEDRGY